MIPAAFVFLEQLPLNPNGKIDRQALMTTEVSVAPVEEEFVPPETETERALADIWAELLDTDRIGRHDDFFGSGGDSMMSIGLVSRVHDAFGVDLPIGNLYEQPTLIALAERIDALRWAVEATKDAHAESTEREEFEV
jgi:acyl carrier protein